MTHVGPLDDTFGLFHRRTRVTQRAGQGDSPNKHLRAGHEWPTLRCCLSGDVLVSHTVPRAVPSALKGLTSGFGMEPGVSLSP
jgi:hypothetical protein